LSEAKFIARAPRRGAFSSASRRSGRGRWRLASFFILGGIIGGPFGNLIGRRFAAKRGFLSTVFASFVIAIGLFITWKGAAAVL